MASVHRGQHFRRLSPWLHLGQKFPFGFRLRRDCHTRAVWRNERRHPIHLFTLRNASGAEARICNYGGLVISLKVPDRNGKMGDVVLGYDHLSGYLKETPYFGAMIGRYGNRIAKGKFKLEGMSIPWP